MIFVSIYLCWRSHISRANILKVILCVDSGSHIRQFDSTNTVDLNFEQLLLCDHVNTVDFVQVLL